MGHIVGGITYRRYAHRALAFRALDPVAALRVQEFGQWRARSDSVLSPFAAANVTFALYDAEELRRFLDTNRLPDLDLQLAETTY